MRGRTGIAYKAKVRRTGHPTRCRSFKTPEEAQSWARRFEAQLDRGETGQDGAEREGTLGAAIARYRSEILPGLRPETARAYARHLTLWSQAWGHVPLSDLTAADIARTRDELAAAGKAPATVNRYLASLSAVLSACVRRWHCLAATPMAQVEKPVERNARTRFLSEAELARLLAACRESTSPDLYLAVLLSITTGARRGEIMGLRWPDLDLAAGTLIVRADTATSTKGGARSLPIVPQARALLAKRAAGAAGQEEPVGVLRDAGLVFPSRVSRAKPVALHTPWGTALRRAGIEAFRWHDLRHSAASFLAKNGASLLEIGAVLGHKSATTTKRYAHLTEQHTHALVLDMAARLLKDVEVELETGDEDRGA